MTVNERKEPGFKAVRDSGLLTDDAYVNARIWRAVDHALDAVIAEHDQLARLHEVATERTVALAAVIEQARALVMNTDGDYLDGEDFQGLAGGIQAVIVPADTDAALRERDAEKWDEGFDKCAHWWEIHHFQQVRNEANPYREGAKTDG